MTWYRLEQWVLVACRPEHAVTRFIFFRRKQYKLRSCLRKSCVSLTTYWLAQRLESSEASTTDSIYVGKCWFTIDRLSLRDWLNFEEKFQILALWLPGELSCCKVKLFNSAKHVDAYISCFKTAVRSRTSPPILFSTFLNLNQTSSKLFTIGLL